MEKVKKATLENIIAVLITVGVSLLLVLIWFGVDGNTIRTYYVGSSYYEITIYPNGSMNNTELMIPTPADSSTIDWSTIPNNLVETEHGQMIKIQLFDTNYPLTSYYTSKLLGHEFSSQEDSKIWIYANLVDASESVYFALVKYDHYNTLGFTSLSTSYEGVLMHTYPDQGMEHNDVVWKTEMLKVELIQGWNQYDLVHGTYTYYVT